MIGWSIAELMPRSECRTFDDICPGNPILRVGHVFRELLARGSRRWNPGDTGRRWSQEQPGLRAFQLTDQLGRSGDVAVFFQTKFGDVKKLQAVQIDYTGAHRL